eukprot:556803-Amphidinium_carterae.1
MLALPRLQTQPVYRTSCVGGHVRRVAGFMSKDDRRTLSATIAKACDYVEKVHTKERKQTVHNDVLRVRKVVCGSNKLCCAAGDAASEVLPIDALPGFGCDCELVVLLRLWIPATHCRWQLVWRKHRARCQWP